MNIAEQARKQGVTPATIRKWIVQKEEDAKNKRAKSEWWAYNNKSAGWNPRAGNKARNQGF